MGIALRVVRFMFLYCVSFAGESQRVGLPAPSPSSPPNPHPGQVCFLVLVSRGTSDFSSGCARSFFSLLRGTALPHLPLQMVNGMVENVIAVLSQHPEQSHIAEAIIERTPQLVCWSIAVLGLSGEVIDLPGPLPSPAHVEGQVSGKWHGGGVAARDRL